MSRFWPHRPAPVMPPEALDWRVRAALGKSGAIQAWQKLWDTGVDVGRGEGITATLLGVLSVVVALVIVSLLVARLRPSR